MNVVRFTVLFATLCALVGLGALAGYALWLMSRAVS